MKAPSKKVAKLRWYIDVQDGEKTIIDIDDHGCFGEEETYCLNEAIDHFGLASSEEELVAWLNSKPTVERHTGRLVTGIGWGGISVLVVGSAEPEVSNSYNVTIEEPGESVSGDGDGDPKELLLEVLEDYYDQTLEGMENNGQDVDLANFAVTVDGEEIPLADLKW